ncbi:hypothetical protein GCM10011511_32950 [Puia dinghuensis]|uniref:HTH marR-type domain-containing protein n=1 Tax=Puia dinghuensis TaxID=1792502 RepID=A0A8J2UEK6_9BACT|nr:hypothetical protein GCM10011511_32950 [Puia dinghuensis]
MSYISFTNPSFLAKSLLLSPSTMTRLLDKLEKKDIIYRLEYDGIRMVSLTPKGHESVLLLGECENAFRQRYRAILGEERAKQLSGMMNETTDLLRGKGDCRNADAKSGGESRYLPAKLRIMGTRDTSRKVEAAYLQKAISYEAYVALIDDLVAKGQTTGPDQSEAFIHYTVLNQQRMRRWEKTMQLLPAAEAAIRSITHPQTWLVLTEAWCGDAAHITPIMQALAALNPLITLRFLMRDDNLELMDRYLTNGVSRSIPKLIGLDTATLEELFTWGPRPAVLQANFMQLKQAGVEFHAIKEELQRWYNKDKTISVQEELSALAAGASASSIGMTA